MAEPYSKWIWYLFESFLIPQASEILKTGLAHKLLKLDKKLIYPFFSVLSTGKGKVAVDQFLRLIEAKTRIPMTADVRKEIEECLGVINDAKKTLGVDSVFAEGSQQALQRDLAMQNLEHFLTLKQQEVLLDWLDTFIDEDSVGTAIGRLANMDQYSLMDMADKDNARDTFLRRLAFGMSKKKEKKSGPGALEEMKAWVREGGEFVSDGYKKTVAETAGRLKEQESKRDEAEKAAGEQWKKCGEAAHRLILPLRFLDLPSAWKASATRAEKLGAVYKDLKLWVILLGVFVFALYLQCPKES